MVKDVKTEKLSKKNVGDLDSVFLISRYRDTYTDALYRRSLYDLVNNLHVTFTSFIAKRKYFTKTIYGERKGKRKIRSTNPVGR